MKYSLAGKVGVITGAGSGIGRALAVELVRRGGSVALSDVNEAGLAETVALLGDARVLHERVDVSSREAVEAHRDRVLETFGRADVVINNAGVALGSTVLDMSYEDIEWVMNINFWGVVHGTKAFLPHMAARGDGAIVNISSVFGLIGVATQSAYNASKFAVRGFTEALRQEVADTELIITSVHPGGIKTNIVRNGRMKQAPVGGQVTQVDHDKMSRRFEKMARTTPEQAAQVILDGVEARKVRVLIGPDAYAIDVLQRTLPEHYDVVVRKFS